MLKHLTIEEMVALVSPWTGNSKRHATFASIKEIAPLLGLVEEAHQAVLAVQPVDDAPTPAMIELSAKAARVDQRHDQLARAGSLGLQAERAQCLGAEPPDLERAAHCDEIEAALFPDGMAILNVSYLAESGNTARVARLMEETPAIAQLLGSIAVSNQNKTLLDTVDRWIAAGEELEGLEREREDLLAERPDPASKTTIQEARSQWFRVVTAVLNNLAISKAPLKAIEAIRGPVLRASERAAKRYASGKPEESALDPETQPAAETRAAAPAVEAGAGAEAAKKEPAKKEAVKKEKAAAEKQMVA